MSKTTVLPDNILRRMDPRDRAKLGKAGVTAAEAGEKRLRKEESELHKHIANYLRQHNVWFSHSRMDRKTTQQCGTPDFLLCYIYFGAMIEKMPTAIEVKVGGRKLTQDQESVREQMVANGWRYHVVSSLQELVEIVKL